MKISSRVFFLFFFFCLVLDLVFIQLDYKTARYFTKSLLIPFLILAFWSEVKRLSITGRLLVGAVFFSWMGDVLLLFDSENEFFFIAGLVCFLTAHLFYIRYFLKTKSHLYSFFKNKPWLLLIIAGYTLGLLYVLWPGLGGLKLAVILYATVISCMLAAAFWQYGKLENSIALYFIAGALLFVASDSMLAINKFKNHFVLGDVLTMFTYALAQYFLVKGAIRYELEIESAVASSQ